MLLRLSCTTSATVAAARERRSRRTTTVHHQDSPRANVSENTLHLEDEGVYVQEIKDRCGEEEGSQ
jgi:hypothetical protein